MLNKELYNIARYLNNQYKTNILTDLDRYEKFICAAEIESLLNHPCFPLDDNIIINLKTMQNRLLRNNKTKR